MLSGGGKGRFARRRKAGCLQIVVSRAARGADAREGRRLASLGAAPVRQEGGGVARIGEEIETEAFQKQVWGEKYIFQLASVGWSAGWLG